VKRPRGQKHLYEDFQKQKEDEKYGSKEFTDQASNISASEMWDFCLHEHSSNSVHPRYQPEISSIKTEMVLARHFSMEVLIACLIHF